ncbi:hypothetical protein CLV98_10896 [Dyadobacter jejuensis]|uniref:PKD domain-containing protein n=1 Tax=Dyadobacter jejuensis TaxID=1082580 RepID=A0A316AHC5_9BACT|nr:hypothetical protein [Dyadobacter jejuensis]PWJ57176.1 hypothetical protein CLV98_10896 [Dyadobacter jejuensis]
MKKLKSIILLAVIGFLAGCSKEYVEPNTFSSVAWYTSIFRQPTYAVGLNKFISFADLSQMALSHKWIISEGNYFLSSNASTKDTILDPFILTNAGLESEDKTVHVYFKKSGMQTVRLIDTFRDSVAYVGLDTVYAVREGDHWLMDHTFMVDVYDTLVPQIRILHAGIEIPLAEDTIYVSSGDSLQFVDMTTVGRPDSRSWSVAGMTSVDSVATFTFNTPGTFTASFISSRTNPLIPAGQKSLKVPNPIKVMAPASPVRLPLQKESSGTLGVMTTRPAESKK